MTILNAISLFGGLSLFLYGMRLMGDGLKSTSAGTLKQAMEKVTNNSLLSFLLGLLVTSVIQSSTATIVLTSGLVGAGIITLHQSLGIILGANVGTTITGQIIRLLDVNASAASWLNFFKPDNLAPMAAIVGILLIMAFRFRNSDTLGEIAMGFSILFTGLLSMTAAVTPLSQSESFANLFVSFSRTPVLGFLAGTAVAFTIQSSSATIGILQALSTTGALTFGSVYAIIIGVNMGDCITTAIVCSIGSKADAKRTGLVHVIFNLFALVLVVAGVTVFRSLGWLDTIWDETITSGGIANAHTLFRLVCAVLLLPFVGTFEKMACKIIRDDNTPSQQPDAQLPQLDKKLFSSPALALSSAANVLEDMAGIAQSNLELAIRCLLDYDAEVISRIQEQENHLDAMTDQLDQYLFQLAPHTPKGELYDRLSYYTQCFSTLERVGDHAMNIASTATELSGSSGFSPAAREELTVLSDTVQKIYSHARSSIARLDIDTARRIEPLEEVVDDLVATLRKDHIQRLHTGICTTQSGMCFLEVLSNLERISDLCSNIGLATLSLHDPRVTISLHEYAKYLHSGKDEVFNEAYALCHAESFRRLKEVQESYSHQ